jgi:hypothetical protein
MKLLYTEKLLARLLDSPHHIKEIMGFTGQDELKTFGNPII